MSDETDEYLYVYRVLVKEGVELIPIARERIGISKITETKFLYFEREIFFNGFQFFNIVRGGNRGGGSTLKSYMKLPMLLHAFLTVNLTCLSAYIQLRVL